MQHGRQMFCASLNSDLRADGNTQYGPLLSGDGLGLCAA